MGDDFKYSGGKQGESGKEPSSGGGKSTAGRTTFGGADTPNMQSYPGYERRGVKPSEGIPKAKNGGSGSY